MNIKLIVLIAPLISLISAASNAAVLTYSTTISDPLSPINLDLGIDAIGCSPYCWSPSDVKTALGTVATLQKFDSALGTLNGVTLSASGSAADSWYVYNGFQNQNSYFGVYRSLSVSTVDSIGGVAHTFISGQQAGQDVANYELSQTNLGDTTWT